MKNNSIDTVHTISNRDFKQNYLKPQKPLVIKGFANDYPAGIKWTPDYIKKTCGEVSVDIFDNAKANKASAFTTPDCKMKFADYMDILIGNKPALLRIFLFNMFKEKPELCKDFPCPKMFRGILGRIGYMFFGAKGIKVRIHQDMDMSNVMLTQFYGRKKVVLVAPKYSTLLYKLPFNTHSLIDLDNPDYQKYPGLRYIETYEYVLDHGDSLFIPSGYWHYITYLDGGFAVSYRKLTFGIKNKITGLLNLCIYMPLDKLMNSLWGEKWLAKKERMAESRANEAIKQVKGTYRDADASDLQLLPQ